MESKKIFYIILVAFYIIAVCTRLYWMNQKAGLYIDEVFSIVASNYDNFHIEENFKLNRFYSGKAIKEASLCANTSAKNAIEDIFNLYFDNRDAPHTNLYYSFFRISLIGVNAGNIEQIIFRGVILNLVFFTFSYIFFFLLVKLIFGTNWLALVAVSATFMSTAAISNTVFLRPYQIQEMLFIILAYFVIRVLFQSKPNLTLTSGHSLVSINLKNLLLLSTIACFVFLTGYYATLYVVLFGLFITLYTVRKNKFRQTELKNEIIFYCIVFVLAFMLAHVFYPNYYLGFLSYRATETLATVKTSFFDNLINSFITPLKIIHKHYFNYWVLGVIALLFAYVLLSKNKIRFTMEQVCLPVISVLFSFMIIYIAPFKILRYIMPVLSFLIIISLFFLKSIKKNSYKIGFSVLLVLAFWYSATEKQNIEYLFSEHSDELKFLKSPSTPVLIVSYVYDNWSYFDMLPYLNNTQNYIFSNNSANIDENIKLLKDIEEFDIVICKGFNKAENQKHYDNIANSNFKVLEEYNAGYIADIDDWQYKCFKVKR